MSKNENDLSSKMESIAEIKEEAKENKDDPKKQREILDIEEWLESEYHVGSVSRTIYPFWKEKVIEFFTEGYSEAIIDGSLGSGKTFCGTVISLRKLYELSCYKYPQRLIGLSDTSDITMIYLSVKKSIARKTGYSEFRGFVEGADYFQDHFMFDTNVVTQLRFPKNVYFEHGSGRSDIIGSNLLTNLLDESNHFKASGGGKMGDLQKVRDLYADATNRRKNRFTQEDGTDPGFSIVISSSTHSRAFIERRKQAAGDDALHIRGIAFKVKPWKFSDEKFWVFTGNQENDPEIIDSQTQFERIVRTINEDVEIEGVGFKEKVENLPESMQELFIDVPVDLRDQFESDIINALQGLAGQAIGTKGDFFNNEQVWNRCESESIPFAFNREEPVLSTGDSVTLQDYFNKDVMLIETDNGYYEPKMNPERKRFIHIDLSSTKDPTGMAMCHISGFKDDDGKEPIITYDFMVRIKPPSPPDRLSHEKIRKFVLWLKQEAGYRVENITMDSYSSEGPIQWFNEHVVPVKSNKKKDKKAFKKKGRDTDLSKWSEFSKLLYEDRVNFSPYEVFRQEFYELEVDYSDKGGTVDHPKEFTDGSTGHNDVSCAVVNAGHTAIQSEDYYIGAKDEIDELVDVDTDDNPEDVLDQYQGNANKSVEDIYMDRLEEEIIDLL